MKNPKRIAKMAVEGLAKVGVSAAVAAATPQLIDLNIEARKSSDPYESFEGYGVLRSLMSNTNGQIVSIQLMHGAVPRGRESKQLVYRLWLDEDAMFAAGAFDAAPREIGLQNPRRRRNNSWSPQAQSYLRGLASGMILPETVERRIRELKEEADDLEYFQRDPARLAKIRTVIAEFEAVLKADFRAAVERSVEAVTEPPKPAPVASAKPLPREEFAVPAKTHDGFRLDEEDRRDIGQILAKLKVGRMSKFGIRDMIEGLHAQETRAKGNKDRLHDIQTKIMRLEEALWIFENGITATRNPLEVSFKVRSAKLRRRNSDEDLRSVERLALSGDADAHARWLRLLARQDPERLESREEIVRSMARAFFVTGWADHVENGHRVSFAGQELMDLAPPTNAEAFEHAQDFARRVETANKLSLDHMFDRAAFETPGLFSKPPTKDDFGHYLAMEGMGSGVAWSDDRPEHGFEVPHVESFQVYDCDEHCPDEDDDRPNPSGRVY